MRNPVLGYLLLAPTVILLGVLVGWPLIEAVVLSFNQFHPLTRQPNFVGLRNYAEILTEEEFWNAFKNNFIWLAGSLVLQISLGVALALMLNRSFPGRGLARTLILFPYLLPVVVAALIWQWMLDPLNGVINAGIEGFGLPAVDWLGEMPEAMIAVITVGSWRAFPFVVIAVLARLQSIPAELYEAAEVDGASAWGRFWDVTMPQLGNVLFVVVLLRAIWDFREFDLLFLMTGGGPLSGTTTLPLLVYKEAFEVFQTGRAQAIAVVMLLVMAVLIAFYFALSRRGGTIDEA